ncbi:DUF4129 domain-containing protein [Hymenobacter gummosus]|uniref:DUF4129 domain-containing protein n=1 Tax=Hymenobacter gummosus TaxID=1776032 RepID=A0A431U394_9BACT|nr:DUF4129 domain-containing protein [Hymenobacter gummosus]RTQ50048.1 DUF4129 domain-containing protein [Hymenobacter gummosus]
MRFRSVFFRRLGPWLMAALLLTGPAEAQQAPTSVQRRVVAAAKAARARSGKAKALRPIPPGPNPAAVREFGAAELRRLRQDDDLQYQEAPPADNPLARWWRRLMQKLFGKVFSGESAIYWKILGYGLALTALVLVIMQLLGLQPGEWLRGRNRRVAVPYDVTEDNVHEATLPERLRQAEEAGQWRLATRLGYLLVLKGLTDVGLIDWRPEKTNHHYDAELRQRAPRRAATFGTLTWQFEYVWYGEFPLTAAQYEQIRAERRAFLTDLATNRAA